MGGATKSEEVIQRIEKLKDKCICVRGNREKYIIEGMPLVVHDEKNKISREQLERNEWTKRNLSDKSIDFIKKLPKEIFYKVEDKKIYIVHYPMKEDGNYKKHIKIANADENKEMFLDVDADIYLYGHTHINIYNNRDNKMYINPGALGCPGKTSNAPYGILEINGDNITYNQFKINYEVQTVINDIEKTAFPGYKSVLQLFYGVE